MTALAVALVAAGCAQGGQRIDQAPEAVAAADALGSGTFPEATTSRPVVETPRTTLASETGINEAGEPKVDAPSEPGPDTIADPSPDAATQPEPDGVTQPDTTADLSPDTATQPEPDGVTQPDTTADLSPDTGVDERDDPNFPEDPNPEDAGQFGLLIQRRLEPAASGCDSPFVAPGGRIGLSAGGFAPNSEVSFDARGVTISGAEFSITIPATTADGDGVIDVVWTTPSAPSAREDPEPRGYIADAVGVNEAGTSLVAYMGLPIVAYPGTPLCTVDDAATTGFGQPVVIDVLANDVAPEGGSLDAATVEGRGVVGGELTVDPSDGSLTFAPDPGFVGTTTATYAVYDNWGLGVEGEVTLSVELECTITIAEETVDVAGTEGDDVICADDLEDTSSFEDYNRFHIIDALGGDDIILGGNGVDWIYSGEGNDIIYGRAGGDWITADDGDTVYGGPGYDTIHTLELSIEVIDDQDGHHIELEPTIVPWPLPPVAVDDHVHLDPRESRVIEVLDNDHDVDLGLESSTLEIVASPAAGSARVVSSPSLGAAIEYTAGPGAGTDTVSYSICDPFDGCATAQLHVTVGYSHCTITGTEGPDTLRGTPGDDVICGLGGNDTIDGLGGNDTIIAGAGNDIVRGGPGNDRIWGGAGNDRLDGEAGNDTIWGDDGLDSITGGGGNDDILGGNGNDILDGGDGDDTVWGGPGNDTIDAEAGNDTVWGGPGNDTADGAAGNDTLWGDDGNNTLRGGDGDDTIRGGHDHDTLMGGAGDDGIEGRSGDDTIRGGDGDDELFGSNGDDHIEGEAGADRLWGSWGSDLLDGGDGDDYLNGLDYTDETDTCLNGEIVAQCELFSTEPDP